MHHATTISLVILLFLFGCVSSNAKDNVKENASKPGPIPVIYDSDIGDDIDDTWALAFLLKSPELDLKLVVGDHGKQTYRASLFAKLLERAGRTDVPVGLGVKKNGGGGRQSDWVKGYALDSYPGKIYKDGVQAIIDTIMNSKKQVTLICVGPMANIREALKRKPEIAQRTRFVGMHGSVRLGYGGSKKVSAEYNVRADIPACKKVFEAPWAEALITPLDTCGLVHLTGKEYQTVYTSKDPVAQAVIENYRVWAGEKGRKEAVPHRSSTLFDTVAVYLAFSQKMVTMEKLPISVNDKGFTVIDEDARPFHVATEWKDMKQFEKLLAHRLTHKKGAK